MEQRVEFRSVEEEDIKDIHRRQNEEDMYDLSAFFETNPPFIPMSLEQTKEKVEKMRGRDGSSLFMVVDVGRPVGMGYWSGGWDPRAPFLLVVIWRGERGKGFGAAAVRAMLDRLFNETVAEVVHTYVTTDNHEGIDFAKKVGFRKQGAMRRVGIRDGKFYDGVFLDITYDEYMEGLR